MLFQRAIIVTIDADNAEDADFTAAGMAKHIENQQNRYGCENETAVACRGELSDNADVMEVRFSVDPEPDDEPPCTYPSDIDATGKVY